MKLRMIRLTDRDEPAWRLWDDDAKQWAGPTLDWGDALLVALAWGHDPLSLEFTLPEAEEDELHPNVGDGDHPFSLDVYRSEIDDGAWVVHIDTDRQGVHLVHLAQHDAAFSCWACGRPMGESDFGEDGLCVPCTSDRMEDEQ